MLVLSRKKNESIVIDDRIVITVVEIRGDKVRLGIEAPKDVPVHRDEVYQAIQRNLAAMAAEELAAQGAGHAEAPKSINGLDGTEAGADFLAADAALGETSFNN